MALNPSVVDQCDRNAKSIVLGTSNHPLNLKKITLKQGINSLHKPRKNCLESPDIKKLSEQLSIISIALRISS